MKALIVRLSSIGDVVHTLPALAALRHSGWEAGWVVEPAARSLLEGNPSLSQVVETPPARRFRLKDAQAALRSLRVQGYDVALDFQGLWKSAGWARLAGTRRVLGYGRRWRREPSSALLIREAVELPPGLDHVIDRNLALLRPLGIEAVGAREFPLPPTELQARKIEQALAEAGHDAFVLLNPGGGWSNKLWPPERYGALARPLRERGFSSLVTWGPGEQELADRVVAASGGAAVRCVPTTLLEYLELARRARLVVAADTGTLHIACAVGTPVVGLYGPTHPARNGPFSPRDVVVRRVPPCFPCHRRRCEIHDGIMADVTVNEVLDAVDRRLRSATGSATVAV